MSDSREPRHRPAWQGGEVIVDADRFWQAVQASDARYDGWVYVAVTSTGIYCRPGCPARTPKRENVRFFPTAAAAQAAGFRACKRCRPDAAPGSPEWDRRADLVGRAMRLIADGIVDREGVAGLARRLSYTERHVHRELVAVVGVGPLALARAQRAQTARILLETTELPVTEVALAAGFGSVRQFNATVQQVFAVAPGALRARARRGGAPVADGAVTLRLAYRAPLDAGALFGFFADRAVPGLEEVDGETYRRSLRLPHGGGIVELRPQDGHLRARFWLDDLRDLGTAAQRTRALLDLDSDPQAVVESLGGDPLLGRLVRSAPGRRVPGSVDGDEIAVRAVLGQQVSLRSAATLAGRLVASCGSPLARPVGAVTHAFPSVDQLAAVDPDALAMPAGRRRALLALAAALARGELALDMGADREEARRRLLAVPGIGPWSAEYVAMRALRDPDAFLTTDLGVRRALARLGVGDGAAAAAAVSGRWRPYRAYAMQYLWASLREPAPRRLAA